MTHRLALFGHPVKHSLSPEIHRGFARQFNLNIQYDLIDVSADRLEHSVRDFFDRGGHGANITVPYKQSVLLLAEQLTNRAHQAGSVNTLYKERDQLWGDNTDGDGLINDFKGKHITTKNKRLLIIGAGGAVQGILPSLLKTQPDAIYIHNRSIEKAQHLANRSKRCHVLTSCVQSTAFDLVIHGTSLGHVGQSPSLKKEWFKNDTTVYDLSYGEAAEPFLNKVRALGVQRRYDGLGMLYHQAALAFYCWFNHRPKITMSLFEQRTEP